MRHRELILLFFFLIWGHFVAGSACVVELTDTVLTIQDVVIIGKDRPRVIGLSGGQQTLNSSSIKQLNADQLGDIVKHLSGVLIKDYGGLGGIKTISVRSLGANHTAVSYDGMTLSNTQTGEIDLGRFSLETLSSISLSIGLSNDLFLPANSYASSSLLTLTTQKPRFLSGKDIHARGQIRVGSFGLVQPSFAIQHQPTDRISWSLDGDYSSVRGDFPFQLVNGQQMINERREHSDMQSGKAELNGYSQWTESHSTHLKVYFNQSERQLPGSIILYQKSSGQELEDRTQYVRLSHLFAPSNKMKMKFNAHFSNHTSRYIDRFYLNNIGGLDNRYRQNEFYLGAIASFTPTDYFEWVVTTDLTHQTLMSSQIKNGDPLRLSSFTVASGRIFMDNINLQGGVLQSAIWDRSIKVDKSQLHYRLSPFATLDFRMLDQRLSFRLFYKEHHRMPTFADLYYVDIMSRTLRPERAKQYNLSVNYTDLWEQLIGNIGFDLFVNQVSDKIIAMPSKNLYIWSMMNLGKVLIRGASINGRLGYDFTKTESLNFDANYTFQQAHDVTDPGSRTYRHQIAYTPRHTGSVSLGMSSRWVDIAYNALYSSSRYVLNQNNSANWLAGYVDQSVSISRNFSYKAMMLGLKAECLNLFNQQYQVIRYYPMPGRNYRIQFTIKY